MNTVGVSRDSERLEIWAILFRGFLRFRFHIGQGLKRIDLWRELCGSWVFRLIRLWRIKK